MYYYYICYRRFIHCCIHILTINTSISIHSTQMLYIHSIILYILFSLSLPLWLSCSFQSLVQSAIIGIATGILLAFPILVLATGNFLTGTYATITIVFVVVSVLGFIPLLGWQLGVGAILMCSSAQLTYHYIIHTRRLRTQTGYLKF